MLVADADVQSKPPKTSAAVINLLTAGILGRVKAARVGPLPEAGRHLRHADGTGRHRTICPNMLYDHRHGRRQETF